MKIWPSLLTFLGLFLTYSLWALPPVIYGEDNREEVYQSSDLWKEKAKGVAVLVHRSKLTASGDEFAIDQKSFKSWLEDLLNGNGEESKYRYSKLRTSLEEDLENFEDLLSFCPEERFTEQPVPGDCTGFLIAPNLLLTAGHCAQIEGFCEDHNWVFDFKLSKETRKAPSSISSSSVYSCKKVIRQELNLSLGLDYALIELDRNVLDREALEIEKDSVFTSKSSLTVIGSPSGLPLKVSGKGKLRSTLHPFYFVSTLDTYKGNSGSPVFNSTTGLVEGVLVRGEEDFVPDQERMCLKSKRCEGNECQGESVSKILGIPEISFREILFDAVTANDLEIISDLKGLGIWLDMPNRFGLTALMQSMKFPHLEIVESLLGGGADPRRIDKKGEGVFHKLAPVLSANTREVFDLLLLNGAELDLQNEEGETPLLKASRWLNLEAVEILIRAGANAAVRNNKGEGILDHFEKISDRESVDTIQRLIEEKNLAEHEGID